MDTEQSAKVNQLNEAYNTFVNCPNSPNYNQLQELLIRYRSAYQPNQANDERIPLEMLQLNVCTYRALKHKQINSIQDLLSYSQEDLAQLPGMTEDCLHEIVNVLEKQLDLTLSHQEN